MKLMKPTEEFVELLEEWDGQYSKPTLSNTKNVVGIKLYESWFIDSFIGRAHPASPLLWWTPIIVWAWYAGFTTIGAGATVGWSILGYFIWTLFEYCLHRWFFHLIPSKAVSSRMRQFLAHGYHHEFPNDKTRLVAPPFMAWSIGSALALTFWIVFPSSIWFQIYSGTVIGYVLYDLIHYYTHHFTPTTRLGLFLRDYHLSHHYKDSTKYMGISNPIWDVIFGTYAAPHRGARKKKMGAQA